LCDVFSFAVARFRNLRVVRPLVLPDTRADATTDPSLVCRLPIAPDDPFPIQNLPFGAFARAGEARARVGVAIGTHVLDLAELARAGIFDAVLHDARAVFGAPRLNAFLACGRGTWRAVRERLSALLDARTAAAESETERASFARALVPAAEVRLELPIEVGDYVDFYASRYHAEAVGRLFRPNAPPLFPNWRWMPVGYHGRASGIVVDGTPVVRPCGQRAPLGDGVPAFAPSAMLDFELELGFVTGDGPPLGATLDIHAAREAIFGFVVLNDWSARDLQAWENQPLGPFLSKAFATSISPWIVTTDALAPFAVEPADSNHEPLRHLRDTSRSAYDIAFEVEVIASGEQRAVVTRSNSRYLFWSAAQMLTHLSSCGARVRAGDIFGTGTISGPDEESAASLLERTARGTRSYVVGSAERTFLEDGDEVVMRARCARDGARSIGFGSVRGRVVAAHSSASASVPFGRNPSDS
jgi:fumarylacetoacetase